MFTHPHCCEALEPRRLLSVVSQTLFSEDFENGAPGWTVDTTSGIDPRNAWAIIDGGHHGLKCAATANPGISCTLTSPPLNLPAVNQYSDHLYLNFWQSQDYSFGGTPTPNIREWLPALGAWGAVEHYRTQRRALPRPVRRVELRGRRPGGLHGQVGRVGLQP